MTCPSWDNRIRLTLYSVYIMMHHNRWPHKRGGTCNTVLKLTLNQPIYTWISFINYIFVQIPQNPFYFTFQLYLRAIPSNPFYLICPIMQHYVPSTNVPQIIWIVIQMKRSINCDNTLPHKEVLTNVHHLHQYKYRIFRSHSIFKIHWIDKEERKIISLSTLYKGSWWGKYLGMGNCYTAKWCNEYCPRYIWCQRVL